MTADVGVKKTMAYNAGARVGEGLPAANRRLQRMRFLAQLLDQAILLPGGYRIGLDPILGLIPGFGDWLGAMLSAVLVYDAAKLGVPYATLARMGINILVELGVGTVPVAGDVFDAVWKANLRNVKLVEAVYRPGTPERSFRCLFLGIALVVGLFVGLAFLYLGAMVWLFYKIFS